MLDGFCDSSTATKRQRAENGEERGLPNLRPKAGKSSMLGRYMTTDREPNAVEWSV